jgi:hypothetical protein
MAHRHKSHKKSGGRTSYTVDNDVEKDAKERKSGGSVQRAEGGKVAGRASGGRLDRRARGGRTGGGSDKSPFSSAHMGSKKG